MSDATTPVLPSPATTPPGSDLMPQCKNPAFYPGTTLCARCASGYPVCANTRPDGTRYEHTDTCQRYVIGESLCPSCIEAVFA